jgi:hypothetical protein
MAPEQQLSIENNIQIFYIGTPRYIGTTDAKVALRKITGLLLLVKNIHCDLAGLILIFHEM